MVASTEEETMSGQMQGEHKETSLWFFVPNTFYFAASGWIHHVCASMASFDGLEGEIHLAPSR